MSPDPRRQPISWTAATLAALPILVAGCATSGPARYRETPRPEPAEISVLRDLPYAVRDGGPLLLDVYRPPFGRRPGVVVIHPGGWFSGDKRDVARTALQLARDGYVAVAPRYRLAPHHRFPAQIHDLKEAVRWMRARADDLGLDPERIAAYGYSSGGHLAALLATTDPDDGLEGPTAFPGLSSRVQALVAGGTPSDLASMPANPAVSRLLGGSASERPRLAADASPLRFVSADDPPAFLFHGRLDVFIGASQAQRLQQAFQREGVPARLELGMLGHFSTWLFGRQQQASARDFLDEWIGSPQGARVARETLAEPRS